MKVFLDTSAILAILDGDDALHGEADTLWQKLLSSDTPLLTSNYVLVESFALTQRRLGMEAVLALQEVLVPLLEVVWVEPLLHGTAIAAWLKTSRRALSLVDCISFEVMRAHGVAHAFAFDCHFIEQGFQLPPV